MYVEHPVKATTQVAVGAVFVAVQPVPYIVNNAVASFPSVDTAAST